MATPETSSNDSISRLNPCMKAYHVCDSCGNLTEAYRGLLNALRRGAIKSIYSVLNIIPKADTKSALEESFFYTVPQS